MIADPLSPPIHQHSRVSFKEAVVRVGKRALKTTPLLIVAALAFAALFFFNIPFPAVMISAGALGVAAQKWKLFPVPAPLERAESAKADSVIQAMATAGELAHTTPSTARSLRVFAACVAAWNHCAAIGRCMRRSL